MRLHWNRVMSATYDNTSNPVKYYIKWDCISQMNNSGLQVREYLHSIPVLVYLTKWLGWQNQIISCILSHFCIYCLP